MSQPITNTIPPLLGSVTIYQKVGERMTFSLEITVEAGIDLTGVKGQCQIRNTDGLLLHDFGESTGSVDGDGTGHLLFDASSTVTADWSPGLYWLDATYYTNTFGPIATKTYKVIIAQGPTQA